MCMHFGMTTDGDKDQCINMEGFASFLGLLESIPVHNIGSNDESHGHAMPDSRCLSYLKFMKASHNPCSLF